MHKEAKQSQGKKAGEEGMGYPALETLLEQDNPDLSKMQSSMEKLLNLSKASRSPKEKAAAKHALTAYQRFFEMLGELHKIKDRLQEKKHEKKK